MAGVETEKLGERLKSLLESKGYIVHCAHGKKLGDGHVCHPKPFFGNKCSHESSLSIVDIVILKNDKVKLLCEIEESGATPKKIIGDIVNIMLSDGLCIHGKPYEYDKPKLILGLKVTKGGKSCNKAKEIKKKLQEMIKESYWNLLDDIEIVCDGDTGDLIDKVEKKIRVLIS